jgi:putative hydrolase of the HAD superfamily
MTIRVILFDLGDTLFGLGELPDVTAELAEELRRGTGLPAEAAESVCAAAIASSRTAALESWQLGHTDEPPLAQTLTRHFEPHIALPPRLAMRLAAVVWRADVSRFRRDDSRAAALDRFRAAGLRLAAVSNTTTDASVLDAYLDETGLLPCLETVVYSSAVGIRKPHVEIYREALKRVAVEPEEAFFVGDRVREDVLGPRSAGIRAALTHEFRQEDPLNSTPDAILTHLDDLHGVLAALNRPSSE